jgi:hypothetical protein
VEQMPLGYPEAGRCAFRDSHEALKEQGAEVLDTVDFPWTA